MAVYDLTHTAAQIDETATKVLTTGEIAKMVRDEVKAQLSAITTGVASVPVFDSTQIMKLISIANFTKVVSEQYTGNIAPNGGYVDIPRGVYLFGQTYYGFGLASFGQSTIDDHTNVQTKLNIAFERVSTATIRVTNNRSNNVYTYYKLLWYLA